MNRGEAFAHLGNGNCPGWVSVERVMGRAHLGLKPMLHGAVTGHQDAQAIPNHFAFSGVISAGDLGFDEACHFCGQRDTELLGCAHDGHPCGMNRIESYSLTLGKARNLN